MILGGVTSMAGVLIFGEVMGVSTVAGILCILAGVCILR
jgi:multidrug transporter EmrE-like cation transporter